MSTDIRSELSTRFDEALNKLVEVMSQESYESCSLMVWIAGLFELGMAVGDLSSHVVLLVKSPHSVAGLDIPIIGAVLAVQVDVPGGRLTKDVLQSLQLAKELLINRVLCYAIVAENKPVFAMRVGVLVSKPSEALLRKLHEAGFTLKGVGEDIYMASTDIYGKLAEIIKNYINKMMLTSLDFYLPLRLR